MTKIVNGYRGLLRGARVAGRALWRDVIRASRRVAWPEMLRRQSAHAGGVSSEWLRTNAIESAKHVGDS